LVDSYNQAEDFAELSYFENVVLGGVNPAYDALWRRLGYKYDMLRLGQEALEPPPDHVGINRITKLFA
jgi:hypothetical protein